MDGDLSDLNVPNYAYLGYLDHEINCHIDRFLSGQAQC